MKHKTARKLNLSREILRDLDPDNLKRAAGGVATTSENCTQLCTNTHSDGGQSFCHCAFCVSVPC